MLKFIRKYQLIILAIGGSLLMVVFLFEPIIGRLSPDSRKSVVAKLNDGTKFNGFDYQQASFDLAVIKKVFPLLLLPIEQGGLGIDSASGDAAELHWLLLSKQAKDAGLVGEAGEGQNWIPTLARRIATVQVQQQAQQGLIFISSQAEFAQAVSELAPQYEGVLTRNVALATGMMRGTSQEDVYRTLATARGIDRLYRVFSTLPAFSDLGAIQAAKERHDAVAVDAVLIKGESFANSIPIPSDAQLQTFFDQYKADTPSDNDYAIGYTQPTRIKVGWLTLNKAQIESGIEINRVELKKTWIVDHKLPKEQQKYPGDFDGERANIEDDFRTKRAFDLMFEADKILRSQTLQAIRGLSKDGDHFILPDDWDTRRPTLEAMAQAVVDGLSQQLNATIPLPVVEMHTDRWLSSMDIAQIPGFGQASYRIGSRIFQTPFLPQAIESEEAAALLTVQPQIPLVDPAAEDDAGNRYYAIVYRVNPAGPADSIDDVGRAVVLRDYRTVKGYELLSENLDSLIAQAQASNDLNPAIDAALSLAGGTAGGTDIFRPGIARNLLVKRKNVDRGRLATHVESGLNTPDFRDAVFNQTESLDELAPPQALAQSPILVGVSIPSAKSIGLAKVIAPRPMTLQAFNANINKILTTESGTEIREAMTEIGDSPFSLASMSERYGYTRVQKKKGVQADPVDESTDEESESEDSENDAG